MAVTENAVKNHVDSSGNQLVQGGGHNRLMNPEQIDFDECLKDSPKFRQTLKDNLTSIEHLENSMSKTIKYISNYIESGRDHIKSQRDFISSMRSLSVALGSSHQETTKRIAYLLETFEEIGRLHEIVIDQSARTVGNSLTKLISDDLLKLREARKSFDKISHEHDQALLRYSQPVKKQQDDSENLLIATSTAFTHTSLDLSIQVTTLQSKKGYEILSSLLSLVRAHGTFFHQGYDLFEDFKPQLCDMEEHLSKTQNEFELLTRNLPSKHLMVSNNELRPLCFDNQAQQVHLEGYLFKRASNGFKVWNRRWFVLKDHQLIYLKRSGENQPIVMEEDLRLLTVRSVDKTDIDRRFCFEIVSPHKSHILQADSESACKTWIQAIQAGINAAFHDTDSDRPFGSAGDFVNSSITSQQSTTANNMQHSTDKQLDTQSSATTSSTSWSSSFSLKALQQQATNKLNSLTGGDTKDSAQGKDKHKFAMPKARKTTCFEDDGPDERNEELVVDEQGRSYALLRHADDQEDDNNDDEEKSDSDNSQHHVAKYPAPAAAKDTTAAQIDSSANKCNLPAEADIASTTTIKSEPPEKPQRSYMIILGMPGNDACADCGAPQPRWASINLGITLCIECAGIHRSLGVHLSKVRSLTLDIEVWSPEIVKLMLSLGNNVVNSAYLACYRDQVPRIHQDSGREERENWIKTKYLLKTFMRPPDAASNDSVTSNDQDTGQENAD